MEFNTEVKNLASLVTFRQLYDDGKSDIYHIISKFAESIILTSKIYSFDVIEMSEAIRNQFGFDIPDYVIQTSLKRLECLTKENNRYSVDVSKIKDNTIENQCKEASDGNKKLVDALLQYVEKREMLNVTQKEQLVKDFCAFVLDESNGNAYSGIISGFILEMQDDLEIVNQIKMIKEGAVLFAGINYNSNVSEKSAWKLPIVFYVETEILFHLAGYNGEVFKRLADDLFLLISEMNLKGQARPIKIRYFAEVKEEIEDFFKKAEDIVKGNDMVSADNYAMNSIVNGCKTTSDVISKKSQFYSMLRAKGIFEAEKYLYYAEENYVHNIESPEYIEKYELSDDKEKYIKHLNYVNILRKGKCEKDLKNAEYVVLTENGKMLRISKDISIDKVPLAINMYILTNRLWYDLNKGFGAKDFPSNFDMLLKSKIVLSSMLSQNVYEKYEKARNDFIENKIDAEQMADVILMLREEAKKPEDIEKEVVKDVLEFISEENIEVYQSEKARLANKLNNKKEELNKIKEIVEAQEKSLKEKAVEEENWKKEKCELIEKERRVWQARYNDKIHRKEKVDLKIQKNVSTIIKIIKGGIISYYLVIFLLFCVLDVDGKNLLTGVLAIIPPMISCIIMLWTNKNLNILEVLNVVEIKIKQSFSKKLYDEYDIKQEDIVEIKNKLNEFECCS